MAWTDSCRLAACSQIKHKSEKEGLPVRRAIKEVAREIDIPSGTLKRWYYPKTDYQKPGTRTGTNIPTKDDPEKFWKSIARRMKRLGDDVTKSEVPNDFDVETYKTLINGSNAILDWLILFDEKIRPIVLKKARKAKKNERARRVGEKVSTGKFRNQ